MDNWTYVGRADFGSNPGVSLVSYTYDEVLAVAHCNDFDIWDGQTGSNPQLLTSTPSLEFYWIPALNEVQLAQSVQQLAGSNLLITVLFNSTYVRTYKVRAINRSNGSTTNYNTASHGYLDVYCR